MIYFSQINKNKKGVGRSTYSQIFARHPSHDCNWHRCGLINIYLNYKGFNMGLIIIIVIKFSSYKDGDVINLRNVEYLL